MLFQLALRHIKLRRESALILLIEVPTNSNAKVVIYMVAQPDVSTIWATLVQIASLGVNDLESVVQVPIHPGFPKDAPTLHASIECLHHLKRDFGGYLPLPQLTEDPWQLTLARYWIV